MESWASGEGPASKAGASYRALEVLPRPSHLRPGLQLWSQVGGTWEKGSARGWGSQKPRLHIAKHLSSNPDSTLTSCVTSLNKLLHLLETSLSSLWVNQEIVLPQRAVGMLKGDKAWKHLVLYWERTSA